MAKKNAARKMSELDKLIAFADSLPDTKKKQTRVQFKTDAGSVNLTVPGRLCLNGAELIATAETEGGKLAFKKEGDFGRGDGSGSMNMDGKAAGMMAVAVINGFKKVEEEEEAENDDDTATDGAKKPEGATA
jgi:hypothetical protein